MKFVIEDEAYEFEAKMTIEEAMIIQEKAFLSVGEFGPALDKVDPRAVGVLFYLLKRRNKEAVKWDDILKLDIFSFRIISDPEEDETTGPEDEAAAVKKAPANPTKPGRTRKGATSGT